MTGLPNTAGRPQAAPPYQNGHIIGVLEGPEGNLPDVIYQFELALPEAPHQKHRMASRPLSDEVSGLASQCRRGAAVGCA